VINPDGFRAVPALRVRDAADTRRFVSVSALIVAGMPLVAITGNEEAWQDCSMGAGPGSRDGGIDE
jgi:hypothetical protein